MLGRPAGLVGWPGDGVNGRRRAATTFELAGRLVVGADGLHSIVARQVGAALYAWHAPLTCAYYAYWSGVQPRRASFHPRSVRLVLVWPTNDDLTCVYVAWRHAEFARFRAEPPTCPTSTGPRRAGLGDAGHHKDPSTGMAMSDAFVSAELLAAAIDEGLAGPHSRDERLAAYAQSRDAATANASG